MKNQPEGLAVWAIVGSRSSWYHVSRVIFIDGAWWELYWHPQSPMRGNNKAKIRKAWREAGLGELARTIFTDTNRQRMNELTPS